MTGICAAVVAAFLSSTYWLWALLLVVFVLSVLLVVFMYSRYTTLVSQKQGALERTYLKYETKFAARKSYVKVGADEITYMIAKKHWVTNSPQGLLEDSNILIKPAYRTEGAI